ncbi:MAP3K12-binding inhibitory protein 1-like isoform X1 [Styela clava]
MEMESDQCDIIDRALMHINTFLTEHKISRVEYDKTNCNEDSKVVTESLLRLSECLSTLAAEQKKKEEALRKVDSAVVQITASNQQLNERIRAFMSHAQNVVDEQNVKEFCDVGSASTNAGCARTNACYKPRSFHSSHMQVSKAKNTEGPQLRITSQGLWREPTTNKPIPRKPQTLNIPQPVAERLENLESHLQVDSGQSSDIYGRLKNLENRVLAIEGASPEYFVGAKQDSTTVSENMLARHGKTDQRDFTLQEIDDRIRMLKQELCNKKRKLDEGLSLI